MDFENTTIWTRMLELADRCYALTDRLPPREVYSLSSQTRRAACSVYANFVEGWARDSVRDSAHYISMSRASLSELKAHLMFCERRGWIPETELAPVFIEIDELRRILSAVRIKLLKRLERGERSKKNN